jgi:hypothetical protein
MWSTKNNWKLSDPAVRWFKEGLLKESTTRKTWKLFAWREIVFHRGSVMECVEKEIKSLLSFRKGEKRL